MWMLFILPALIQVTSALPGKRGACVVQCVPSSGQYQDLGLAECPSDHECRNTGCGAMCFPTSVDSHAINARGSCIMLCGDPVNKKCGLNGYDCSSNGCGRECKLRADYVQPPHCPAFHCDLHCPTGYYRNDLGCDVCQCAYTIVDSN
ncbi:cysteine-rich motor neuron 1 protein-like [Ruditapes philippinarum]|uniref:cysteine-rich motor neuron 1 protein-like n=1 Tax=Ruditapes philippinarum TaxID=129788 RepID=UPI00295AC453|nr:cysteine-rich motor neuron 1 protein-like [Ruditapes philippinarum]